MADSPRDVISCPFCGADVIRGSDSCDGCGRELAGIDLPESALNIGESHFAVSLSEVRTSKPSTVAADATVAQAVAAVAADANGAAVVVEGHRVIGIFTERDVLKKVAGKPAVLSEPVTKYMTPDPVLLREDDTMATALHKMGSGNFRHIPLARDGQLVAMVSARDILNWLLTRYFE